MFYSESSKKLGEIIMARFSLLLADDENIIRNRVRLMLGSTFDIQEASSAKQALEEASRGFDVVILDIMFPDGNGCLLYTSPSPRDGLLSRMPSSA